MLIFGKKTMRIILLLFLAIFSFSCRQDYRCVCTADDPVHDIEFTATMTRSAAEDWCREWDNDVTTENDEEKLGWKCELK
jgi:hypothetical protein